MWRVELLNLQMIPKLGSVAKSEVGSNSHQEDVNRVD